MSHLLEMWSQAAGTACLRVTTSTCLSRPADQDEPSSRHAAWPLQELHQDTTLNGVPEVHLVSSPPRLSGFWR